MPKLKPIESLFEVELRQALKDAKTFEPPIRMQLFKLCIQWTMVQHKIKDSEGFGTEFMEDSKDE